MNDQITNCATCGWVGEYDPTCDCIDCNVQSEAHLAQHNNRPSRKPMLRAEGPSRKSTLADVIELAS